MGIRINSAIVFGVEFTAKETRAFEKFMKGKPTDWFLMRMVEQQLKFDWKLRNLSDKNDKNGNLYYEMTQSQEHLSHHYVKLSKKTKCALQPYRPFWDGVSKKKMAEIENDLIDALRDYLVTIQPEEAKSYGHRYVWWPHKHSESEPANMFGYNSERGTEKCCPPRIFLF